VAVLVLTLVRVIVAAIVLAIARGHAQALVPGVARTAAVKEEL